VFNCACFSDYTGILYIFVDFITALKRHKLTLIHIGPTVVIMSCMSYLMSYRNEYIIFLSIHYIVLIVTYAKDVTFCLGLFTA